MKQKAMVTLTTKLVLDIELPNDKPINIGTVNDYISDMRNNLLPSPYPSPNNDNISVNGVETEVIWWNVETIENVKDEN